MISTVILLTVGSQSVAQSAPEPPPPIPNDFGPEPPPSLPINTAIPFMLFIGVLFAYKVYKKNKQTNL